MASVFLRLLAHDDKPAALAQAVDRLRDGEPSPDVHVVDPESFRQVPESPFAYWVSEKVRGLFTELSRFEGEGRHACVTNPAGDDRRFFRGWWEVPVAFVGKVFRWRCMAKGGHFSKYYSDIDLVADWDDKEGTFQGFFGTVHRPLKRPASADYFFKSGITYSSRTQLAFSARVLPGNSIFHAKGPGIFAPAGQRASVLGIMNSLLFQRLLELQMTFGSYEVGVIQRTPVPDLTGQEGAQLARLALDCISIKRTLDRSDETTHVYHLPALSQAPGDTLARRVASWQVTVADTDRQLAENQREIDDIAFRLYGIDGEDRRMMETGMSAANSLGSDEDVDVEDES